MKSMLSKKRDGMEILTKYVIHLYPTKQPVCFAKVLTYSTEVCAIEYACLKLTTHLKIKKIGPIHAI